MHVREIMSQRIDYVDVGENLLEAARTMRDLNVGSLVAMEHGRLAGIITDRDIVCRGVAGGLDLAVAVVGDIMSREAAFCFADDPVSEAAHLMELRHIRRLAVLNHDKSIAGFLSVDDLARYSRHLAGEVLDHARPTHH